MPVAWRAGSSHCELVLLPMLPLLPLLRRCCLLSSARTCLGSLATADRARLDGSFVRDALSRLSASYLRLNEQLSRGAAPTAASMQRLSALKVRLPSGALPIGA
jgi:hypothetical protein